MGKKIDLDLLMKTLNTLPLRCGQVGTEDFNKRVISIDMLEVLLELMPDVKT